MSELTREARSIVEAARDGDKPTAEDKERIRQGVLASVAALPLIGAAGSAASSGSAASAGAGSAAAGAGTAGLLGGTAAKLIVVTTAVVATGVGATVYVTSDEPTPPVSKPPVVAPAPLPPEPKLEVKKEEAQEPIPEPVAVPEPKKTIRRPPAKTKTKAMPAAPHPIPDLRAESALIQRLLGALSDGDAERALEFAKEHERQFPTGLMLQDRMAGRAIALCMLGESRAAEAKQALAAFLKAAPSSPHVTRVKNACAAD